MAASTRVHIFLVDSLRYQLIVHLETTRRFPAVVIFTRVLLPYVSLVHSPFSTYATSMVGCPSFVRIILLHDAWCMSKADFCNSIWSLVYGGPFEKISTASNSYISKYFDVDSPDQWRWGSSRYAAFKIKEDKPVCIIPVPRQCDRNSPVLEVVEVMNERPLQSEVKQQIGLCVVRNVNCVSWVREDGVKGGGECLAVSHYTEKGTSRRHIKWCIFYDQESVHYSALGNKSILRRSLHFNSTNAQYCKKTPIPACFGPYWFVISEHKNRI